MSIDLGYQPFDCDNHYYEARDAFTRHVPKQMQRRCVQWAEIDGRLHHVVGGKISHAVKNPTWDPIAKPGAIADFLRGNPDGTSMMKALREREPLPDYYMDRDARIKKMDEQGIEAMWLFPTLGVLYEELLKEDTEAVKTLFHAFNRWVGEDWGVAYQNRIFGAPYITLCDVDFACAELEWALKEGARVVCMRPSAIHTPDGVFSPSHTRFDPFWARVSEAGITVVIHAGDSGYTTHGYVNDGFTADAAGAAMAPNIKHFNIERAAYDFLITLAFERLFERFPGVRIASIENGAEFLPDLFRKLRQSRDRLKIANYYKEDPGLLFKEHVWINPFWEDDVYEVEHFMGADRVIFGSDWPHIEGMPQPLDYVAELSKFDDAKKQKILRDNTRTLNELRPA
ncbi:MAG: amidohydrolase family protein [Spirochaetaceae bacterium]|nr:amidohydrolase family protein [Myxococcales bacterium]MCB9724667.1 amidohydrolase family protein [Spirochaetaceae bacterium]